jgi:hypothetical protein
MKGRSVLMSDDQRLVAQIHEWNNTITQLEAALQRNPYDEALKQQLGILRANVPPGRRISSTPAHGSTNSPVCVHRPPRGNGERSGRWNITGFATPTQSGSGRWRKSAMPCLRH